MSPTTGTNEEIIEKRDTSPVATSCVILATLALLGAIALQLFELGEHRAELTSRERDALATGRFEAVEGASLERLRQATDDILADAEIPSVDIELYEEITQKSLEDYMPSGDEAPGEGGSGAGDGADDDGGDTGT